MFRQLLERRVFQFTGIYLGAIVAAFEFTDMAVQRYGWSDRLVDMVLTGMLMMLPSVILMAWFHGKPGKDEWRRSEAVAIPLNAVIAVVFAFTMAPSPQAQALSETRTVTAEDGETFVVEVPSQGQVARVGIFFPAANGLDESDHWQAYATSILMTRALDHDPFMIATTFYEMNGLGRLFWRLQRGGVHSGLGGDVTLLREIAKDYYQDYFTTGSLAPTADGLALQVDLYQTEPLQRIESARFAGSSIFKVAESATQFVRERVGPQQRDPRTVEFVPMAEVLTPDLGALETYIRGRNAWLIDRDAEAAISLLHDAVQIDPGFARAFVDLADFYANEGDFPAALEQLKAANRLSHKLTDVERILLKGFSYQLRNQSEKAVSVFKMWVELEPDNHLARNVLANVLKWNGNRVDEAIAQYERSLELLPTQDWILNRLGDLYRVQGRSDDAVAMLERYHERQPDTYEPLVTLGDIMTQQGDLDAAAKYYRQGNLVQSQMVTPVVRLAENAARRGAYDEAFDVLEEADFVAQAPRQVAAVHAMRVRLLTLLGRPSEALEALKVQLEYAAKSESPLDGVFLHLRNMHVYAMAGRADEARSYIASIRDQFQPPFDFVPSIGALILELHEGDLDAAESHRERVENAIVETNRLDMLHLTVYPKGHILRERGDPKASLEKLLEALELFRSSIQQTIDQSRTDEEAIILELARTYLALERPDDAQDSLRTILVPWPSHPEANLLAARASLQAGDRDAAQAALIRAMDVWHQADPDFRLLEEARALEQQMQSSRTN